MAQHRSDMDALEDVIAEAIYEAIQEFSHPQAVDPVGEATRKIMRAVTARDRSGQNADDASVHIGANPS